MVETKERQAFSRNQTIVGIVLIVSVFLLGLGYQQTMFQHRAVDSANCYRDWGRDVIDSLDARSSVNSKQKDAERARDNAVDDVLTAALDITTADPPLTEDEKRTRFVRALSAFARAKARLAEVDSQVDQTQRDNQYPELNCS